MSICQSPSISVNKPLVYLLESYDYSQYNLQVATSLYSLLPAIFAMRPIEFVIAGATLAFFNTYAYAIPVKESSLNGAGQLQAEWCDGYTKDSCAELCQSQGYRSSHCSAAYVQMPSYKSDLVLTCKPQSLFLRVSYYLLSNFQLTFQLLETALAINNPRSSRMRIRALTPRVLVSIAMLATILD